MEQCGTCKFYKSHDTARDDGYCLRNAPSPTVHSINVSEASLAWQVQFSNRLLWVKWPTVSEDDWCGEYQSDNPNPISFSQNVQEY
jgi:hypothetical protein